MAPSAPTFIIHLKYGGFFHNDPDFAYKGGRETSLEILDLDYLSYFDLLDMIKDVDPMLREREIVEVCYCVPDISLSEGLRKINLDNDVIQLSSYGLKSGIIEVFVTSVVEEHGVDYAPSVEGSSRQKLQISRKSVGNCIPGRSIIEVYPTDSMEDVMYENDEAIWDRVGKDYPEFYEDFNLEEDPTYIVDENEDGDSTENDSVISGGASSEDDEEWYLSRKKLKEMLNAYHEKINADHEKIVGSSNYSKPKAIRHHYASDSDDEYLNSPLGSDDDEEHGSGEMVAFKVDSDANLKKLVWRLVMKFSAPEVFKEQVIRYGAFAGYCVRWYKNQKNQKLAAKCKKGCDWNIYASWDGKKESFVVKRLNPTHTCNRQDFENLQVTPRFLAKEYLGQYKRNPNWSRKALQDEVLRRFGKRINRQACYTVKKYAHEALYGSIRQHYKKLGSYLAELQRADNNTNVVLFNDKQEIPRAPDVFKRLYVSFPGIREGFLKGCRPIICLDGCFLKTYLGGMLLCVVGRDGNNQMYPVAWAVVEAENNNSWSWFLNILKKDLPGFGGENCTVSSDQQKGLCNAVMEHFPNVEHRNCARHIYANWRKKNKGDELKMHFWRAARAYTIADFEIALGEMGMVSKKAVEDFIQKNPRNFCRSHLKTGSKSEVIVNNLAETFNGYIIEARSKPLINMLEEIRLKIMERLFNNSLLMAKEKSGEICPRIKTRLDRAKEEARQCESMRASEAEFQVMHHTDMFSVHIVNKTCSCRKWDLTGIPCCHAISSLNSIRVEPEKLIYDWFKKEKYDEAYSGAIRCIRGEKHWPKINYDLDPPKVKVRAGRPQKNRRKDPFERFDKKGKLTKHGVQMTCSNCNEKGHNKRKCSQENNTTTSGNQPPQVAKPRGRPRKDGAPAGSISATSRNDPMQQKKKRGRPKKVVSSQSQGHIPNGIGVYFGEDRRVYINPGQSGGIVLSDS